MKRTAIVLATVALIAASEGAHAGHADNILALRRAVGERMTATESQDHDEGTSAAKGKGVAEAPDKKRFMVSKPVGAEHWVVTWDAHVGKGDVSGIVLTDAGVIFITCRITGATGDDLETDSLLTTCYTGDGIVAASTWKLFGDVAIPALFFLP